MRLFKLDAIDLIGFYFRLENIIGIRSMLFLVNLIKE